MVSSSCLDFDTGPNCLLFVFSCVCFFLKLFYGFETFIHSSRPMVADISSTGYLKFFVCEGGYWNHIRVAINQLAQLYIARVYLCR